MLVFNVALMSYRDLNLQNAKKMTSIQDFAINSTSINFLIHSSQLKNNPFEKYYII